MPKTGPDEKKIDRITKALTDAELSITQLAKRSKMPMSTVFVYLKTFMKNDVEIIRSYGTDQKKVVTIYTLKKSQ